MKADGRKNNGNYLGNDKPRKPELWLEYPAAFNLTGSFKEAAKMLDVEPNTIRMWFQHNGYKIIKQAVRAS